MNKRRALLFSTKLVKYRSPSARRIVRFVCSREWLASVPDRKLYMRLAGAYSMGATGLLKELGVI